MPASASTTPSKSKGKEPALGKQAARPDLTPSNAHRAARAASPTPSTSPSPSSSPSPSPAFPPKGKGKNRRKARRATPHDGDASATYKEPPSSSRRAVEPRVTRSRGRSGVEAYPASSEEDEGETMKIEERDEEEDDVDDRRHRATPSTSTRMPLDIREVISQEFARKKVDGAEIKVYAQHVEGSDCWMPGNELSNKNRIDLSNVPLTLETVRHEWTHLVGRWPTFGNLAKAIRSAHGVRSSPSPTLASFSAMAMADKAPEASAADSLDASHLCGQSRCCQLGHVVLEANTINSSRDRCHSGMGASLCAHDPPCLELLEPKAGRSPRKPFSSASKGKGPMTMTKPVPFEITGILRASGSSAAEQVEVVAPSQPCADKVLPPVLEEVLAAAAAAAAAPAEAPAEDDDLVIDDSQPLERADESSSSAEPPVAVTPPEVDPEVVEAVVELADVAQTEAEAIDVDDEQPLEAAAAESSSGAAPPVVVPPLEREPEVDEADGVGTPVVELAIAAPMSDDDAPPSPEVGQAAAEPKWPFGLSAAVVVKMKLARRAKQRAQAAHEARRQRARESAAAASASRRSGRLSAGRSDRRSESQPADTRDVVSSPSSVGSSSDSMSVERERVVVDDDEWVDIDDDELSCDADEDSCDADEDSCDDDEWAGIDDQDDDWTDIDDDELAYDEPCTSLAVLAAADEEPKAESPRRIAGLPSRARGLRQVAQEPLAADDVEPFEDEPSTSLAVVAAVEAPKPESLRRIAGLPLRARSMLEAAQAHAAEATFDGLFGLTATRFGSVAVAAACLWVASL
ncbi:hypothetical protein JCM9279_003539 [Rhodotorula babjevae]